MSGYVTGVDWGEQAGEAPYPTIPKSGFELHSGRAREMMELGVDKGVLGMKRGVI